ncbi:piggyBac transposable element-derived protein 3-like [Anthonomus grandis grandis]|uniref:piggyBac transposable element-derived protein 3-like n=1 Tax=Anthonomus grandis grandis TaxID=2921223 RepID=UPI002165B342|nr:piggyBac transposable element-derived protein 3-like [Anthonomus grandis grandis]
MFMHHPSKLLIRKDFEYRHWRTETDEIPTPSDGIIIFPPDNANDDVTDCDSGDEDVTTIDHLPGSQLRNDVELIFDKQDQRAQESDSDEDMPLSELRIQENNASIFPEKLTSASWLVRDLYQHSKDVYWRPKIEPKQNRPPLQLFTLFFDDDLFSMITTFTNTYAAQKNLISDVTDSEIQFFVGVLILSGYIVLPKRYMYWENRDDSHSTKVAEAISRDRFTHIMKALHVCDNNNLNNTDKFAKIRPLYDALNKNFLKHVPFEHEHSIDEAMVPYFGRHPTKQFIRNKPIRWGYKLWTGDKKPTKYCGSRQGNQLSSSGGYNSTKQQTTC